MQIFYLETNEEVPSIIERIRAATEQEVALVVPVGALLLQSIVNLKLVKRDAEKNHKNLYLVTTDKIGRNLASQVGLTVYEKIEKGQVEGKAPVPELNPKNESDKKPTDEILDGVKIHRYYTDQPAENNKFVAEKVPQTAVVFQNDSRSNRSDRPKNPGLKKLMAKSLLLVILLLLIFSTGYAFWAYPKATLNLKVRAKDFQQNIPIAISDQAGADNLLGAVVKTEKSATKTIAATGSKDIGEKATGSVTVYNEYSTAAQPLQAGTRMQTSDGKVYRLDADIIVPGGDFEIEGTTIKLKKAGQINANASADQPGDSYNIDSANLTIPGIGRDNKIYAKTPGFKGGLSKTVKVVAVNDISDARIDLTNDLTGQAQTDAKEKTAQVVVIAESTEQNITSFTTNKKVGDEAENFEAKATISLRMLTYNKEDLKKLLDNKTKAGLSPNQELVYDPDQLKIVVANINLDQSKADLAVELQGKIIEKIDQKELAKKLKAKSLPEAKKIISEYSQITEQNIKLSPNWWFSRLPYRPQSLKLEIKYE